MFLVLNSQNVFAQVTIDYIEDPDGNTYPIQVLPDGKLWITKNLNLKLDYASCFEGKEENCDRYGRLYVWEEAVKGCRLLGEGWYLPSAEEWQNLASFYNGVESGSFDTDSISLIKPNYGNKDAFPAVYAGLLTFDGVYLGLESLCYFWSSTTEDSILAKSFSIGEITQRFYRSSLLQRHGLSVRCVKK